jgi:uncharacterized protein YggE
VTRFRRLSLIAVLLSWPAVGFGQQSPARDESLVVTSGDGVVQAVPDRAWMSVSAESRAPTPREAQRRNADAMKPVLDRLRTAGVPADGIRTSAYDLQPEFDFANNRRTLRGYVARNVVTVRIDAVDRAGELIDAAVTAGATAVDNIRFDVKDRARLERDALRLAVVDARARADAAAAGAGRTVDRIVRIEEAGVVAPPMPVATFARVGAAADAAPPIAAGELEIRAHVTLTVSIK